MPDTPNSLTIRRPDDWHLHLREGAMLKAVLPYTAAQFGRAIIMPNLKPPVTTVEQAKRYAAAIRDALPEGSTFQPLMTCYLTDGADADEIARGHEEGVFTAVKLYPAHATTNSAHGVTDLGNVAGVLERMERIGMPLLIHGEVTDPEVDIFDREAVFIERVLSPLLARHPGLKVVFEHITTEEAAGFVAADTSGRLGATITAHHLVINRSHIFAGGIRPHLYCLPIAKRERHRLALRRAAISGTGPFFLGTDSAPHAVTAKESACGCAGVFTAPTAVEVYAQVFAEDGALDEFEAFASLNGPRFYGLAPNEGTITLERAPVTVPEIVLAEDGEAVLPFQSGETLNWRLKTS
jgi:dihydroorotase